MVLAFFFTWSAEDNINTNSTILELCTYCCGEVKQKNFLHFCQIWSLTTEQFSSSEYRSSCKFWEKKVAKIPLMQVEFSTLYKYYFCQSNL